MIQNVVCIDDHRINCIVYKLYKPPAPDWAQLVCRIWRCVVIGTVCVMYVYILYMLYYNNKTALTLIYYERGSTWRHLDKQLAHAGVGGNMLIKSTVIKHANPFCRLQLTSKKLQVIKHVKTFQNINYPTGNIKNLKDLHFWKVKSHLSVLMSSGTDLFYSFWRSWVV